jgi:hypothetical protein
MRWENNQMLRIFTSVAVEWLNIMNVGLIFGGLLSITIIYNNLMPPVKSD